MHSSIINTVDVVLLTLKEVMVGSEQVSKLRLCVALQKREKAPFAGAFALPGGYVHAQEDSGAEAAAVRTLKAKTGISSPYLEQLGVWSGPGRDPRGWSISVVYFAVVPLEVITSMANESVELHPVDGLSGLPFDHKDIIDTAVTRVRSKSNYSTLPAHFCGEDFTLGALRAVYEAVVGEQIPVKSFRERLAKMDALEEVPGVKRSDGGRPGQVYRLQAPYRHALSVLDRGLARRKQ